MLPSPTDCARSKIENVISQDRAFRGRRAKRAEFLCGYFLYYKKRWSGDSDSVRLGHCSLNDYKIFFAFLSTKNRWGSLWESSLMVEAVETMAEMSYFCSYAIFGRRIFLRPTFVFSICDIEF